MPLPLLSEPSEGPVTFAEPGASSSFSQKLAEGMDMAGRANRNILSGARTAAGAFIDPLVHPKPYAEIFSAADRQTQFVDNSVGQLNAMQEAADRRIATVQEQTGVQLHNPFAQGYYLDAQRRYDDMRARGEDVGPRGPTVAKLQRNIFNEKLDDVAQQFPDKAPALQFYQPIEDQARAIGESVATDSKQAGNLDVNPIARLGFGLAGGLWGARRDPLMVGALFAGPGGGAGASAVARIASGAIKQGLYNAGLSALEQPTVQNWRRQLGEDHGVMPAIENVGLSFLFGAIPGAGIEGFKELRGPAREALARVLAGKPKAGDVEAATEALKMPMTPQDTAAAHVGEVEPKLAAAAGEPARETESHAAAVVQAIRHSEDPVNEPAPDLPFTAAKRPADQLKIIDEAEPAKTGDREMVDGKPVTFERFDPKKLTTDATTFQYKGGADLGGLTDRLRSVTQWDPTASGKAFIFERADGTQIVADGHQRLGLANRIAENDAGARPKLDGFLFREADGWTPANVRALAAKKNMQEGSGDALDAARMLRDRPDILDGALPVSSPMMKTAINLARLSDEGFGMTVNGVVPPGQAAAVGAMVPDTLQHAAVMADLARLRPETEREARLLITEIMGAGFRAEHQINLFGAGEATRSLMGERVKTLDAALQALVKDKKLFGTLSEKADAIEEAGNRLARGVNEQRASDAAALSDLVARLAQRTGPVSDALNRAAARVAEGEKPAAAADAFLGELRNLLDRDGLPALLATPELRPRAVVEPGTAEGLAVAEVAAAERKITAPASEKTAAGEQTLLPGVKPVSEKSKLDIQAGKPLEGGNAPPPEGGLFDRNATKQTDLIDSIAVAAREDGKDVRFISRAAALEEADRSAFHADLVKACKD